MSVMCQVKITLQISYHFCKIQMSCGKHLWRLCDIKTYFIYKCFANPKVMEASFANINEMMVDNDLMDVFFIHMQLIHFCFVFMNFTPFLSNGVTKTRGGNR